MMEMKFAMAAGWRFTGSQDGRPHKTSIMRGGGHLACRSGGFQPRWVERSE